MPFRDASGALVFRPSGHGALLENLNDVDADIVFIKNIDNVMTREGVLEMAKEKKALAGHLIMLQKEVYGFLTAIEETPDQVNLDEINLFLWRSFEVASCLKPSNRHLIISISRGGGQHRCSGGGRFGFKMKRV